MLSFLLRPAPTNNVCKLSVQLNKYLIGLLNNTRDICNFSKKIFVHYTFVYLYKSIGKSVCVTILFGGAETEGEWRLGENKNVK